MASPASPTRPSPVGVSISRSPPASIPRPGISLRPRSPSQNSSRPGSPTAAGPVADDHTGLLPHDDAWIHGRWWVVSGAISRGREGGPQTGPQTAAVTGESRGRGRWVAVGVMVVLAVGAVAGWRAGVFSAAAPPGAGTGTPPPATAVVTRQDLTAPTPESATLESAGSYTVKGEGSGTLTWLPPAGRVLRQGQALYKTDNGSPVVLLYGSVPDWRPLGVGTTGQDVTQLNHDLANLGYAARADITANGWDYYSWETAQAVQRLEVHLGVVAPPGS